MKVILRSDLDGLGKRGDIVEVSDGHARNFLLPKGHALVATDGAVTQAGRDAPGARSARRERPRRRQTIASKLVPKIITIPAKSGPEGKLFGSVTSADIVAAVLDRDGHRARAPSARGRDHQDARRAHGDGQAAQRCRVPDPVEVVAADIDGIAPSHPTGSTQACSRATVTAGLSTARRSATDKTQGCAPTPAQRCAERWCPHGWLMQTFPSTDPSGRLVRNDRQGRVPPHNLEAEESVLGALLLSRDASASSASRAEGRPLLQARPTSTSTTRFARSTRRRARSTSSPWPTSCAATVCSTRSGGTNGCSSCRTPRRRSPTPTRYAKIVQDTAMLRRLIGVASEIAEIAYIEPDDVTKALDEAEIEGLRDRRGPHHRLHATAQELLPMAMDKLQETTSAATPSPARPPATTISTSCSPACSQSTLNIIGARPAMGKTAFGLGHRHAHRPAQRQAGAGLLARDGPHRADATHPVERGRGRLARSCAPAS